MKKFLFTMLTATVAVAAGAQVSRTFPVEQLKKPERTLPVTAYDKILQNLILSDVHSTSYEVKKNNMHVPFDIIAKSNVSDSLVDMGYHPFFNGMYHAYADHRPFVISPDMIWLLISQGFALHVISNAEKLRKQFVNFSGKETLFVQDNRIRIDDPNSPWEEVFPQFTEQIAARTGKDLVKTLTSDFSTTTPACKVASRITIMDAVKYYFDFYVLYISCGIPSVTLEGTASDWQKVLHKANRLRKYDLDWWVDSLEPILQEFINTSEGKIDTLFWKDMFKYHSNNLPCGRSATIDGWIVKFFPYDKNGKRTNLKTLSGSGQLPEEMVKVPLQYMVNSPDGSVSKTPLELWAGFIGLKQDTATFALKPEIGWMIRKKDVNEEGFKEKLTKSYFSGLRIRVNEVPKALLTVRKINSLEIFFTDSIHIPADMQNIIINRLSLHGKISVEEAEKISKLFSGSMLFINDKFQKTKAWPGGK
jgi:hypothetical protein